MPRETFSSDKLPPTAGPFSPAVRGAGDSIYLSGQVGTDAAGKLVGGGVEAQTRQALENLRAVLEAAGRTLDDVVRVGVYLTDMGNFAAMNEVYARFFAQPYPARTTIGVAALPLGAAVEIDLVAK
ncbi:Rid family detoxifying hydrolase [Longimicrobium sp.]|uniref:RidA family protein n=1 Tax=Longimicrobium sp. TaxID=2029185 RepID=UPI002C46AEC6|nr:Rid family detoxifying hydrolase [Longimicrobium sp.]HSU15356.1 Rid family detoxifying hydrolase [Longimicrobium sp.]